MPGLISPATVEQIRGASEIVEIISASIPLKRAGANFVALCPFHREKTPSFTVNPRKQIFYCFGCHKGGDVFSFVQAYENISFTEAIRRLADRARIPLAWEGEQDGGKTRHLKETLLKLHEEITQRWHLALTRDAAGEGARQYLARRGVSAEAVALFRLGYAPDAWDDTVNWAKSKGYDLPLVEQGGLIVQKEGENHFYDRFRGRLIFPICDEQGRVIGFSGRIISGDETRAKYVNSPETPIFTKGRVIFGLDKAKRALLEKQQAIVCEGQLDLIACHTAGVQNVVAPQGTALTADHARILKRYVEEVVLCFDSDPAGRNATIRALGDLLASGLAIRVAPMPAPHDPDSLIRERGAAAFAEVINGARSFFDFYLDELCARHDSSSDRGRVIVVQEMAAALQKTGNAVLTDTYAQKTAVRLGVAAEAVRAEFRKARGQPEVHRNEPAPESGRAPARPNTLEFWFLRLLLLDEKLVPDAARHLNLDWLTHAGVRGLVSRRLALAETGQWLGVAPFLASVEEEDLRALIAEAASEARSIPHPAQQVADVIKRLRDEFLDGEMAKVDRRLAEPALSDAERDDLLRTKFELPRRKREPLTVREP